MGFYKKRLHPRVLVVYALVAAWIWLAQPNATFLLIGLIPITLGEGLRLWATGYLHKTDSLTVTGPYGYLRHPLYLGTLLIATGFAIMTWNGIALGLFGVFLLVYFSYYMPYKDRIESARLEAHFGDAFRRYAVAVPALIPRAHAYTPLAADQMGSPLWQARRFSENHELGTALVVSLLVLAMVGRWASS